MAYNRTSTTIVNIGCIIILLLRKYNITTLTTSNVIYNDYIGDKLTTIVYVETYFDNGSIKLYTALTVSAIKWRRDIAKICVKYTMDRSVYIEHDYDGGANVKLVYNDQLLSHVRVDHNNNIVNIYEMYDKFGRPNTLPNGQQTVWANCNTIADGDIAPCVMELLVPADADRTVVPIYKPYIRVSKAIVIAIIDVYGDEHDYGYLSQNNKRYSVGEEIIMTSTYDSNIGAYKTGLHVRMYRY